MFLELLRSETAASPDRRSAALQGLRAYQQARRPAARPPKPAIASAGRAVLRDYGGHGQPVVFVPSLINPPLVLDLARGNSLLRWLARQGVRPLLVDWGAPTADDRDMDIGGHVESLLVPLVRSLKRPPVLAGYCLGGTMAIAAANLVNVAGLVSIAAPWRFSGYAGQLDPISSLWDEAHETCQALGLVPMEVLQAGFWQMDPARTVAKFERFGRLESRSAATSAFVALEDWANAGAPLTFAAGRQLFDDFLVADLPGRGKWQVGGRTASPEAVDAPMLSFVSTTDRIVPRESAADFGTARELPLGHVGMIVGGRGRESLWQPLADWLKALPAPR
ncbi:alpha/beta fold hydrolase [Sphingomonas sp.]|uniref:alpha/beta fold hydrolase n=1 Tax=Sphingomonas sp. TaxID=28214 RepID=UPI001B03B4DA|nr:alpha/beta fold hydrolase [Sphingomonas sp.]MBO9715075.1 alpha/beta hydrolase [Sphingomonas sp.]